MGRTALIAVLAGTVFVVVALAAITPTLLVDDHHPRGHRVLLGRTGGFSPFPGPGRRFQLPGRPDLKKCVEQHGATPGKVFPRGTFRDCLPKRAPQAPGSSG